MTKKIKWSDLKLIGEHPQHYDHYRQRVLNLAKATHHIGWGYGDEVSDVVSQMEAKFDEDKTP